MPKLNAVNVYSQICCTILTQDSLVDKIGAFAFSPILKARRSISDRLELAKPSALQGVFAVLNVQNLFKMTI